MVLSTCAIFYLSREGKRDRSSVWCDCESSDQPGRKLGRIEDGIKAASGTVCGRRPSCFPARLMQWSLTRISTLRLSALFRCRPHVNGRLHRNTSAKDTSRGFVTIIRCSDFGERFCIRAARADTRWIHDSQQRPIVTTAGTSADAQMVSTHKCKGCNSWSLFADCTNMNP